MRSQTVVLPLKFSYKSVDAIGASSLLSSLMSYVHIIITACFGRPAFGFKSSWVTVMLDKNVCNLLALIVGHSNYWRDKITKNCWHKRIYRHVGLSVAWLTSQWRSSRGHRRFTLGFTLLTDTPLWHVFNSRCCVSVVFKVNQWNQWQLSSFFSLFILLLKTRVNGTVPTQKEEG